MPKISIVIRTTGLPRKLNLLAKTLESVSKQTFTDYEVIIATETNKDEVNLLSSKYLNTKLKAIIQTNAWNRCKTTNEGIKVSSGDFVVILDDDILLEKRWLEKMLKTFYKLPQDVGCIYSRCESFYKEALSYRGGLAKLIFNTIVKLSIPGALLPKRRKPLNMKGVYETLTLPVTCAMFKRNVLFKIGLYDEDKTEPLIGDDYDLGFKLHKHGHRIVANWKIKAIHHEPYVYKQLGKKPEYFERVFMAEIYTYAKHLDIIKYYILPHMIYSVIQGVIWAGRTKNFKVIFSILKGTIEGFFKGINNRKKGQLQKI